MSRGYFEMLNRTAGLILIFVVVFVQTHCTPQEAKVASTTNSCSRTEAANLTSLNEGSISYFVNALSSVSEDESSKAKAELINVAKRSLQGRKAVINKLSVSAEQFDLNGRLVLDPATFRFWLGTTEIFSEIQATEAVDLLISYIYCSDGMYGVTSYHRPAEKALIEIGVSAVPKLSNALLHDPNSTIRRHVALCLGNIGGLEAKHALDRAMQTETDGDVVKAIKVAISTIVRESK